MDSTLTERVEELARDREVTESEILEQAIERGVEDLWTESVLSKYIDGEIERERAVELVGLDRVKRADREVEAVEEDVEWGASA
jgi:predicted transcriptional regulator